MSRHPILSIFIIVVLALAGYSGYTLLERQDQRGRNWGGDASIVVAEPARRTQLVDEIESIGTARANESVTLTSKVTDTVRKVNFEDGMYVEAGDILVELTNSEETAQLAEAQAAADESARQFRRVQNLIAQKLASETQLDGERVRMQTSQARLEAIIARLDDRLIRAPFSGILGFRSVSPGSLLSPTSAVTTLDDINRIKLDFTVPEQELSAVVPGQEIQAVSSAYPSEVFRGTVQTINSRVDSVTRSVSVRAVLNNDERLLRPGMLLIVKLIKARADALVIPEEAVIPIQNRHYVYTIVDGKAQRVEIETGRTRPGLVEVLSGLEEGQDVITQGVIKVRPGASVTVKTDQPEISG